MKKKQKIIKMICALLVLALLGGGYAYIMQQEKKEASQEKEDEKEDFTVTEVDGDSITKLVYTQKGQEITLEKDGDTWYATNDKKCPVNSYTVDAMKSAMKEIKSSRKIKETEEQTEDFGFDKPEKVITYTTKDGEEVTFTLGKLNSVVDKYYFKMTGDSNVYMIDTTLYNSFDYDLLKLAKVEEYPSMGTQDIADFTITSNGKTMYFVDKKDAAHKKNDPTIPECVWMSGTDQKHLQKVDKDTADALVQAIISLSNAECVTYDRTEKDMKKYGLDKPAMTLSVNYTATKNVKSEDTTKIIDKSFSVHFGKTDKDSGEYYVCTDDSSAIYTMNVSNVKKLKDVFETE